MRGQPLLSGALVSHMGGGDVFLIVLFLFIISYHSKYFWFHILKVAEGIL